MAYNLTLLSNEAAYRTLYIQIYCNNTSPIITFDGIQVRFFPDGFDHAFFESTDRKNPSKNLFSKDRSERITWIKETLEDSTADIRVGWDSKTKSYDNSRRVTIVKGNYVVIIWIKNATMAKFITAYVADNSIGKILASPKMKV
jgi:hypothetical protein